MEYLIFCECGHGLDRHDVRGCDGRGEPCWCLRGHYAALESALARARTDPWDGAAPAQPPEEHRNRRGADRRRDQTAPATALSLDDGGRAMSAKRGVWHAHGVGTFRLDWRYRHAQLIVEDRGSGFREAPRGTLELPAAESGRGVSLIALLAIEVSVSNRPEGGACVRVVLPVERRRTEVATGAFARR